MLADLNMLELYDTFIRVLPDWIDEDSFDVTKRRLKQIEDAFRFVQDYRIDSIRKVETMSAHIRKTMINEIESIYRHITRELRSTVTSHFGANCLVGDSPFASNSSKLVNW